jgi:hypothetical protein
MGYINPDLGIPAKVANALGSRYRRYERLTRSDLIRIAALPDEELLTLRNFGPKHLAIFRSVYPQGSALILRPNDV